MPDFLRTSDIRRPDSAPPVSFLRKKSGCAALGTAGLCEGNGR